MSTPTMKWGILLCLAICLVSDTSVSAQIKGQPVSILIHSTIHLESGQSVRLVVTSKEKKYIRASIRNPKKMARAEIIYDGKAITMVEKGTLQSKSRVVSGDEAATNLFEGVVSYSAFSGTQSTSQPSPMVLSAATAARNNKDHIT